MAIFDLFSKRRKRERDESPDVYQYEVIPHELRVQVVHIFKDAIGSSVGTEYGNRTAEETYSYINKAVSREYGKFSIGDSRTLNELQIFEFILNEKDVEKFFDVAELVLNLIDKFIRGRYDYEQNARIKMNADDVIGEFNDRFKEHGVGFQYINGSIIRIDSEFIHSEAIKPALLLLSEEKYAGANEEFHSAFDRYCKGENKEALVDALKAFESVMTVICDERNWAYSKTDTSSKLLSAILSNNLIPSYL